MVRIYKWDLKKEKRESLRQQRKNKKNPERGKSSIGKSTEEDKEVCRQKVRRREGV